MNGIAPLEVAATAAAPKPAARSSDAGQHDGGDGGAAVLAVAARLPEERQRDKAKASVIERGGRAVVDLGRDALRELLR